MLAAFAFALATLSPAAPVVTDAPAPVLVPVRVLASDESDPRDIKRGLRNMAIGAAVLGAGCAISVVPLALFVGALVTVFLVGALFVPTVLAFLPWIASVGAMAAAFPSSVGVLVGITGLFWLGVNSAIVVTRLSPDYKPGPGSEYIDM